MAAKASEIGHGVDVQAFTKAIFEREAIMSTGIGLDSHPACKTACDRGFLCGSGNPWRRCRMGCLG
ncbi:MAG: hypothetical protein PHG12_03025 [Sphaerochaeta sp.]|nr:hypothetical protein [Sphaerochaeta sp.]